MKIKNELVRIATGNKKYDFNNMILNEYLCRFINAQLDENKLDYSSYNKKLEYCLLKFEKSFENLQENMELKNSDFDICLFQAREHNQIINDNAVTIEYSYDTSYIYDYNNNDDNSIENYYGKKITAIGFNTISQKDSLLPVCAILDTTNYNIYIQKNQDLSITRRDVISTDAIFYSNDKNRVPGPVHLAPYGVSQIIQQGRTYDGSGSNWHAFHDVCYGVLYSIGLSSYSNYIDKELIIGKNIEAEANRNELNLKGIENYISTDGSLFPSGDIYPSVSVFPVKTNYKYVIFKYKIWQLVHSDTHDNVAAKPTDTRLYYYQAIPIDKFGKMNLKIKYERG